MSNKYIYCALLKKVKTGTITINPVPEDATVLINGIEQRSIEVPVGEPVNIKVEKENYKTFECIVYAKKGTSIPLNITLETVCKLNAFAPEGYQISIVINGTETIYTTSVKTEVPAGSTVSVIFTNPDNGEIVKEHSFDSISKDHVIACRK